MFYISFHGGTSEGNVNNIYAYHDSGEPHSNPNVLNENPNITLQELRGFSFGNVAGNYDNPYVLNAYKKYNDVLLYRKSASGDVTYDFVSVLASGSDINSIFHPYDLTFDPGGNIFISNQDSNVITKLTAGGQPASLPSFLAQYGGTFLSGTFVASAIGELPGLTSPFPPNVPAPQGLTVSYSDDKDTKVENSVRGILFYDGYLFVCDEPASSVKIYDGITGKLFGEIKGSDLQGPVQLLLSPKAHHLCITNSKNGSVYRVDISNGIQPDMKLETYIDDKVKHISGITFDADGNFYAAKRKDKKILVFPPDGSGDGKDFIKDLPDEPEFIMYVPKGD